MEQEPLRLAREISRAVAEKGGRALAVGGWVRDGILVPAERRKDIDLEVYGIPAERLGALLSPFGRVDPVGKAFGVLKVGAVDVSVPRRETKIGSGHRGFLVESAPDLGFEEAARRRDLTINAMAEDLLTGEVLDPHGGKRDIELRTLRAVDRTHFGEDPLRGLRVCRFAARFLFEVDKETAELCRTLDLSELPEERLFDEFRRMLVGPRYPSVALQTMRVLRLTRFFPELETMFDCRQEYEWHPEGDVWTHTLLVLDAAADLRTGDPDEDLVLMLAALCHDLGKPLVTNDDDGKIRSPNHEPLGEAPTRSFLARLTRDKRLVEDVVALVVHHLRPHSLHKGSAGASAVRRLATKVPIERLVRHARADHYGRTTPDALARRFPAGDWLLRMANELDVAAHGPHPILMGRHLLDRGWVPGPAMGELLARAFEAQLDGRFTDLEGALRWLQEDRP
ncbi:MAG: HD domain-containing protein [Candidatus Latescibacterota bacterium]|nr:MAG: HD domain-containing protein [Candidatus Latescibacterota bacterium]